MFDQIEIKSSIKNYTVSFINNFEEKIRNYVKEKTQFIIDRNLFYKYENSFAESLKGFNYILIEALEKNKNVDSISVYVKSLMENGIKIDHKLVAVGGGIIQDITCFLASTLYRGMDWDFFPTTLLAQCDSCIGSKSSINVGAFKNLMGTFYPPREVNVDFHFLNTLSELDILSGMGEILKVHMVTGEQFFEKCLLQYDSALSDKNNLYLLIRNSLLLKKELIEVDEFDKGIRNTMNYGHTYGHAIESATEFAIPHGIAVSLGMDMANYQSMMMGRISKDIFLNWHEGLKKNYRNYLSFPIPIDSFMSAIAKDKKNVGAALSLILVRNQGKIEKVQVPNDSIFRANCINFFNEIFK
ncbi:MAG: hypothetical protein QE271_07475 [Bacteriovoracaceae bacterium]|nr:hypothetical protein [Bacteriovoracaceae bacterium]